MNDWENIFGEAPASFADRVQGALDGLEEDLHMKKTLGKKTKIAVLAAAVAAALALGAGAYAAYQNSLQELVIREAAPAVAEAETDPPAAAEGTPAPAVRWDPIQEDVDFISLQGYADSPERQAMEEWMQFLHTYDLDGSELARVGNGPTGLDERYDAYFVYTQEMADALDAIVSKYGLTLHEWDGDYSTDDLKELYGDFLGTNHGWCYMYKDGTFQFDGDNTLDGYGRIDYQFRRTMKGVFDEVGLNVTNAEDYAQWNYTTACGVPVLLALGPSKALIFADLDDCFVAVNVLAGTESDPDAVFSSGPLSAEALEDFADSFDFSVL